MMHILKSQSEIEVFRIIINTSFQLIPFLPGNYNDIITIGFKGAGATI